MDQGKENDESLKIKEIKELKMALNKDNNFSSDSNG